MQKSKSICLFGLFPLLCFLSMMLLLVNGSVDALKLSTVTVKAYFADGAPRSLSGQHYVRDASNVVKTTAYWRDTRDFLLAGEGSIGARELVARGDIWVGTFTRQLYNPGTPFMRDALDRIARQDRVMVSFKTNAGGALGAYQCDKLEFSYEPLAGGWANAHAECHLKSS